MSLADSYAAYALLSEAAKAHEVFLSVYPTPEQKELDNRRRSDLQRKITLVRVTMEKQLETLLENQLIVFTQNPSTGV